MGAVVAMVSVASPGLAHAQSIFERLNLDRLQFSEIGASYGAVEPSQMLPTQAYSLHADYGEVAERWRVVFTVAYWGSRYRQDIVQKFADSLRLSIDDPEGNAAVIARGVSVSDIAVGGDIRWMSPTRFVRLRPYLGGNLSVHVINAEGGTFMENALDNIATGVAGVAGVDIVLLAHMSAGLQARMDLLSGIRYGSIRVVGTYIFDRVRFGERAR
jgi:hypothetical protein